LLSIFCSRLSARRLFDTILTNTLWKKIYKKKKLFKKKILKKIFKQKKIQLIEIDNNFTFPKQKQKGNNGEVVALSM